MRASSTLAGTLLLITGFLLLLDFLRMAGFLALLAVSGFLFCTQCAVWALALIGCAALLLSAIFLYNYRSIYRAMLSSLKKLIGTRFTD